MLDFPISRRIGVPGKQADREKGTTILCPPPQPFPKALLWQFRSGHTCPTGLPPLLSLHANDYFHPWNLRISFLSISSVGGTKELQNQDGCSGGSKGTIRCVLCATGFLSQTSPKAWSSEQNLWADFGICLESIISTSNGISGLSLLWSCHCYPELMMLY